MSPKKKIGKCKKNQEMNNKGECEDVCKIEAPTKEDALKKCMHWKQNGHCEKNPERMSYWCACVPCEPTKKELEALFTSDVEGTIDSIPAECLELGAERMGNQLQSFNDVTSLLDCLEVCQRTDKCEYFSYAFNDSVCYLLGKEAVKVKTAHMVSGSKTKCEKAKSKPTCAQVKCSKGFVPKKNAASLQCGDKCDVKNCCDRDPRYPTCGNVTCGNGYTLKSNAQSIPCPETGCDLNLCCDPVSKGATCSLISCGKGFVHKPKAAETPCPKWGCNRYLCCEEHKKQLTCAQVNCGKGWERKYNASSLVCPKSGCHKDLCCTRSK